MKRCSHFICLAASWILGAGTAAASVVELPKPGAVSSLKIWEQRVKSDPEDFIAWNHLGDLYLEELQATRQMEFLQRAAGAVKRSQAIVPGIGFNSGASVLECRVRLVEHRFTEARVIAEMLVKAQPSKANSYALLGDALVELGEVDQASGHYATVTKLDGESLASLVRQAKLARLQGKPEDPFWAKACALAVAEKNPALTTWTQVQRADAFLRHGALKAARPCLESAMAASPQSTPALAKMAELLVLEGNPPEAISLLESLQIRWKEPVLWQALGDLKNLSKQTAEAKEFHRRALAAFETSIQQGHVYYYHHLVQFFTDSQPNPEKALLWAEKDFQLRPNGTAAEAVAWALYQNGKISEARSKAEYALTRAQNEPHLLYRLGTILAASGDLSKGRKLQTKVLSLNPYVAAFHLHL